MIMTCPKCGGSGKIPIGDAETTTGIHETTCPSCGGLGYVTDAPGPTVRDVEEVYLKYKKTTLVCPHCGKEINVHVMIGE